MLSRQHDSISLKFDRVRRVVRQTPLPDPCIAEALALSEQRAHLLRLRQRTAGQAAPEPQLCVQQNIIVESPRRRAPNTNRQTAPTTHMQHPPSHRGLNPSANAPTVASFIRARKRRLILAAFRQMKDFWLWKLKKRVRDQRLLQQWRLRCLRVYFSRLKAASHRKALLRECLELADMHRHQTLLARYFTRWQEAWSASLWYAPVQTVTERRNARTLARYFLRWKTAQCLREEIDCFAGIIERVRTRRALQVALRQWRTTARHWAAVERVARVQAEQLQHKYFRIWHAQFHQSGLEHEAVCYANHKIWYEAWQRWRRAFALKLKADRLTAQTQLKHTAAVFTRWRRRTRVMLNVHALQDRYESRRKRALFRRWTDYVKACHLRRRQRHRTRVYVLHRWRTQLRVKLVCNQHRFRTLSLFFNLWHRSMHVERLRAPKVLREQKRLFVRWREHARLLRGLRSITKRRLIRIRVCAFLEWKRLSYAAARKRRADRLLSAFTTTTKATALHALKRHVLAWRAYTRSAQHHRRSVLRRHVLRWKKHRSLVVMYRQMSQQRCHVVAEILKERCLRRALDRWTYALHTRLRWRQNVCLRVASHWKVYTARKLALRPCLHSLQTRTLRLDLKCSWNQWRELTFYRRAEQLAATRLRRRARACICVWRCLTSQQTALHAKTHHALMWRHHRQMTTRFHVWRQYVQRQKHLQTAAQHLTESRHRLILRRWRALAQCKAAQNNYLVSQCRLYVQQRTLKRMISSWYLLAGTRESQVRALRPLVHLQRVKTLLIAFSHWRENTLNEQAQVLYNRTTVRRYWAQWRRRRHLAKLSSQDRRCLEHDINRRYAMHRTALIRRWFRLRDGLSQWRAATGV